MKNLLKNTLGVFFALWLFAEEVFWVFAERLTAFIAQFELLQKIEAKVKKAPPWLAVALFFLPGLILLPFKIAALYALSHGMYFTGVSTFIAAKIVGTMMFARLFVLVKPTLMTLPTFAKYYTKFIGWKDRVIVFAKSSYPYRLAKIMRHKIKAKMVKQKQKMLVLMKGWMK